MTVVAVVDCETTGLGAEDRLVELATVRFVLEDVEGERGWQARFDPGRPIPAEASAVHHITEVDVAGHPAFCEEDWRDATEGATVLAAHHAEFDRQFVPIDPRPWVCTWKCALRLFPDAPAHGNQVLRYHLGLKPLLETNLYPHCALYDARVTTALLRRMLEDHNLDDLVVMSSEPALLPKVNFGKHRGQRWEELPTDYLQWLLKPRAVNDQFAPEILYTARHHIHRRRTAP